MIYLWADQVTQYNRLQWSETLFLPQRRARQTALCVSIRRTTRKHDSALTGHLHPPRCEVTTRCPDAGPLMAEAVTPRPGVDRSQDRAL